MRKNGEVSRSRDVSPMNPVAILSTALYSVLVVFFQIAPTEKVAIVKVERNSIIQYAERHNQMMNSSSPPQTPNNNFVTIKEGAQKESTLLEMVPRKNFALVLRLIFKYRRRNASTPGAFYSMTLHLYSGIAGGATYRSFKETARERTLEDC